MKAASALCVSPDWAAAVDQVAADLRGQLGGAPVSLLCVFAPLGWLNNLRPMVRALRDATGAAQLVGCTGVSIVGRGREVEGEQALSALALSVDGPMLDARHFAPTALDSVDGAEGWRAEFGPADAVSGFLFLVDPFQTPGAMVERALAGIASAYPGAPIIGGMASGFQRRPGSCVFIGDQAHTAGAVILPLPRSLEVIPMVAQGAQPIGDVWTITDAAANRVAALGGRPTLDVLAETINALPPDDRQRARSNLLVGLAANEYRSEFARGDFLIRNLLGTDPDGGKGVFVGEHVRVGQTLQFQLRDALAATEDLRAHLDETSAALHGREAAALIFCCTGRGRELFGIPNHDAAMIDERLRAPAAGFFCNGEIGPVGGAPFVHGFTASVAVLAERRAV